MKIILKIINNRNFLLISSLVLGLSLGKGVEHLKSYVLLLLAIAMVFSSTSFDFKQLKNFKQSIKTTITAFLLNYVLFGVILLGTTFLLIKDTNLRYGLIVIAATPPGVAIIPFTLMYKGDTNYAMIGVLGVYILAIVVSPLIIGLAIPGASFNAWKIIKIMIEIILIPLLISRLLLWKKIFSTIQKIRGKVVNWTFAIIIYTIIGLNRTEIFSEFITLFKLSVIFAISMFALGLAYEILLKKRIDYQLRVPQNLMLTIKSSGFAAGTAIALFGEKAALPSAILAVFVILYLVVFSTIYNR